MNTPPFGRLRLASAACLGVALLVLATGAKAAAPEIDYRGYLPGSGSCGAFATASAPHTNGCAGDHLAGFELVAVEPRYTVLASTDGLQLEWARRVRTQPTCQATIPVIDHAAGSSELARLAAMPQEAAGDITLAQVLRAGYVVGYRVSRLRPEGIPARLGLEMGDVVLAVNGMGAAQPERFQQTIEHAGDSPILRVLVERQGCPVVLQYPMP